MRVLTITPFDVSRKSTEKPNQQIKAEYPPIRREQRQIPDYAPKGLHKVLYSKIKIQETSYRQGHKIQDQVVVIRILIDKADVEQDQHNIQGGYQPHRRLRSARLFSFTKTTSSQLVKNTDSTMNSSRIRSR